MNLVILAAFDGVATASRFYVAACLISLSFSPLLLNLWIPRFYCRFVFARRVVWGAGALDPWRIAQSASVRQNRVQRLRT